MTGRALNIAVVRPYLTVSKGGAERYALEVIAALSAAGHRVHAYAHAWDRPELAGVAYTRISMPRKPAWLRVLRFHLNLRRALRPAEYDVVLGMTPFWPQQVFWLGDGLYKVWLPIAWPWAPLRRLMTFKRAVMAVNLALEKKMLSPATTGFIANSRLVARQARRLYGILPERIQVVYPWIDTARFHTDVRGRWRVAMRRMLGIADDEIALLFAAHNFKRKGLGLVLQALARVDQKRIRLLVAGAGAIGRFARQAKRLGIADRTTFLGAVGEIERYYGAADGLVLPTQYDPCAAVCLEAMACGLPVITTAMNGAAEFIDDGESGFVLSSDSEAAALARSLTALCDDGWRARAGVRATASVQPLAGALQARQLCAALESFAQANRTPAVAPLAADLQVNEDYLPLLQRHRLTGFTALLNAAKAHQIEYNQNKRISLVELADETTNRRFFVKTHRQSRSWAGRASAGAGTVEWRNLLALRNAGIPTADPVAVGERVISDGSRESLVMTLCLDGYLPADQYIAARFAPPLSPERRREKTALIQVIAALTARMHARGFNHRDFYLCHLFVRSGAGAAPEVRLIDLQRLGYDLFWPRRWRVKDLAQLHYSSLDLPISERDRLRFFARYRCRTMDRKQLRQVLRQIVKKSRAIARHDAKLRAGAPPLARDPFTFANVASAESSQRDEGA